MPGLRGALLQKADFLLLRGPCNPKTRNRCQEYRAVVVRAAMNGHKQEKQQRHRKRKRKQLPPHKTPTAGQNKKQCGQSRLIQKSPAQYSLEFA